MAVPRLLLDTLEDLGKDDFETFKWHLLNDVLDGYKPIPRSKLESSNRTETVRRMIENYGEDRAVNITVEILKMMKNNYAAEKLKNRYAEGTTSTSAVAPPAAAVAPPAAAVAPPAAPATISAQQGSVIIAPTLTGSTTGALNITINK